MGHGFFFFCERRELYYTREQYNPTLVQIEPLKNWKLHPPHQVPGSSIAAICTNDEVHKVETAEDLLLGDDAE